MGMRLFLRKRCGFLFIGVLMLFSCYDPIESHQHTYSSEWTRDDAYHWHEPICGHNTVSGKAEHSYGAGTNVCMVCGYAKLSGIPEGLDVADVLAGLFAVDDDGHQVRFSSGNLYHSGSNAASGWAFEDNQYDFRTWHSSIANDAVIQGQPARTPETNTGLFYWSKDAGRTFDRYHDNEGEDAADTFALADTRGFALPDDRSSEIHDCIVPGYDCLSYDEWNYLCYDRSEASSKLGLATITGVNGDDGVVGLVLLPDTWIDPYSDAFVPGADDGFSTNSYSVEQWRKMEQNGAVFLPAAGNRSSDSVFDIGLQGCYWSSSSHPDSETLAVGFCFHPAGSSIFYNIRQEHNMPVFYKETGDDNDDHKCNRKKGISVRLVIRSQD